jgi:Zn-dependent alcohol dehydrogenase
LCGFALIFRCSSVRVLRPARSISPGDFVILNWRGLRPMPGLQRGRPAYCFDTFNAEQKMTLTDGSELTPLGIGAFADKTLVPSGQCTKVDALPIRQSPACWAAGRWRAWVPRSIPARSTVTTPSQ